MKAAFWWLLAGLEVWIGVLAILLGVYAMLAPLDRSGDSSSFAPEILAGVAAIVIGASLVAHAIRRELGARGMTLTERLGNPLDTPTRPGHA